MLVMVQRVAAEPFRVECFDELADWQLPALPRARAQTGELFRIHAECARHLDLLSIELADPLRVPPFLVLVCLTLRSHTYHLALSIPEF
jgi:hypothetical protein